MRSYLLGLDIGTTGTKSVVFDEKGRVVSKGYREYKLLHREPHLSELDPREVWASIKQVLKESISNAKIRPDEIKAVSTAVMGEAFIPVGKGGEPLYWSMTTFDARAIKQVKSWEENFGPKEMFKITGQPLSAKMPYYTLQKIQWIKENKSKVFRKTWKFLCWEDYFNFRLTGKCVTDYTIATRTMMFDIHKKKWSEKILDLAGIDEDLLPEVKPSGHVVGEVSKKASEETCLSTRTLVVTGGHDQPCGALGAGILEEGKLMDATGTVECYATVQDKLVLNDKMRRQGYAVHVYVLEDKYFMFGVTPTSGSVLRWFRDEFAYEEKIKASEEGRDVYDVLIDEASKTEPGSLNLFLYPYFEGSSTPTVNREARGTIIGLTLAHSKKDIVRAILESLAFELRRNIETFRNYGIKINEIRAIGGGAKSPFWLQLKADITKIDVLVPEAKMETAALGAAILTTKASGTYKTFNEAALNMSRISERYEPKPDKGTLYDGIYERYFKLQKRLLKFYA